MTSLSISVERRCSSVQCIFIPSQMKKQLVVPVMLLAGVGRRGTHHKHTLGLCCNKTQIQTPGAPPLGTGRGISSSIRSLLIKQHLNLGRARKWLLPPLPQERRGFQHHRTRTSRFTLFHPISTAGKVGSRPQVLLWQKAQMRTGFYSDCVQRKIEIDNTAALFTGIFEMLVMKGLSLTPSHSHTKLKPVLCFLTKPNLPSQLNWTLPLYKWHKTRMKSSSREKNHWHRRASSW